MTSLKTLSTKYLQTYLYSSSFSQAWLREERVVALRSVRDVDDNSGRAFLETYLTANRFSNWKLLNIAAILKPVQYDLSKSGKTSVAFFNNGISTAGTKKENGSFIEIVDEETGSARIETTSLHGKVIGDSWFGGLSWSTDERYVIYVAQSFSVAKKTAIEELANADTTTAAPNKFDYKEDWGEKYVDIADLSFFVLDVLNRKVIPLSMAPAIVEDYTVGQPTFLNSFSSSTNYGIAFTAWNIKPRRLGMIYCYQRPSSIWTADITASLSSSETVVINPIKLSNGVQIARSARSSPDGRHLVFLGNRKGFLSHNGCSELLAVNMEAFKSNGGRAVIRPLVEEVVNPLTSKDNSGFPGLFLDQLPRSTFVSNEEIAFTTLWRSRDALVKVNIASGELTNVNVYEAVEGLCEKSSFQTLEVVNNQVLGYYTNPTLPPRLAIVQLAPLTVSSGPSARPFAVSSKYISNPAEALVTSNFSQRIEWKEFAHNTDGIPFNSILMYPVASETKGRSIPLVVVPHGGPHSSINNIFIPSYVFLVEALKVGVLFVNYRGSTGFGQDSITSLLGKIGTNDVADIMTSLDSALQLVQQDSTELKVFDESKVGIVGGSHGGFLGAHMCGQYPNVFKACALRNPVTNIPAMASVTDIPDWCHAESGSTTSDLNRGGLTTEELAAMREVSPIAHLTNYQAPTLVCLGAKDRRVPYSQGIEFHHLLKMKGVPTRMMIFPEDVHAIDNPTSEAEHWIAIADWLAKYLQIDL